MWLAVAIVIACAGCKQLLGIDEGVVGGDANHDAPTDVPDATSCLGPSEYSVCPPMIGMDLDVAVDTAINTTVCLGGALDSHFWCVISARSIRIDATVTVTGSYPLVLAATDSILVTNQGLLDASSRSPDSTGPNANFAPCVGPSEGISAVAGGSGGGGGGLTTLGGNGGNGGGSTMPGAGGQVIPMIDLRGGCKGGRGGTPSDQAGSSGGALYLVARNEIDIDGKVNASGAGGGSGRASKGGGSGGGSGGVIFVAAPAITFSMTGQVWANGGGGGGGADNGAGGQDGARSLAPTAPGSGGPGGSAGVGVGGAGAIEGTAAQPGTNDTTGAGGGGGGGGLGAIRVFGQLTQLGQVSPHVTM